jgi:hypothetical protein
VILCVVGGDGILPVDLIQGARPSLLHQVNGDLRVAVRPEPVAALLQLRQEDIVIEDLSVHRQVQPAPLVADGLVAHRRIDDGQPPHAQEDSLVQEDPLVVRPAVHDAVEHPVGIEPGKSPALKAVDARDAAHSRSSLTRIIHRKDRKDRRERHQYL